MTRSLHRLYLAGLAKDCGAELLLVLLLGTTLCLCAAFLVVTPVAWFFGFDSGRWIARVGVVWSAVNVGLVAAAAMRAVQQQVHDHANLL